MENIKHIDDLETHTVRLNLVAEIEVQVAPGDSREAVAQRRLDAFREATTDLESADGICITTAPAQGPLERTPTSATARSHWMVEHGPHPQVGDAVVVCYAPDGHLGEGQVVERVYPAFKVLTEHGSTFLFGRYVEPGTLGGVSKLGGNERGGL